MPRFHRPVNPSRTLAAGGRYSRGMTRPWRRWIAGLLMVTLPLQAAIAAAGLCGLPHGGEHGSAVSSRVGAAADMPPCHEAGAAGVDDGRHGVDTGVDTGLDADADGGPDATVERCHACAACATAVALPADTNAVPALSVAASPRPWTPVPVAVRAAPPPEPPPRA